MPLRASLLAVLLACPVAAAQPTAADSALVERTLVALDFGALAGSDSTEAAPVSPAAAEAAAREAFYADLRPSLLLGVVRFLESPEHAVWVERLRRIGAAELAADPAAPRLPPAGTPLADEALARRYIASTGMVATRARLLRELFEAMERLPEFGTAFEQIGVPPDVVLPSIVETRSAEVEAALLAGAREVLAGVAASDVEEIIAFNESAGARYLRETMARSALPLRLAAEQSQVAAAARPMLDDILTGFMEAGWAFASVDEPPKMVGGVERVRELLDYPESARREGVEGRVLVVFVVDEKGQPGDAVVVDSPDERLSEAALAAVARVRFVPGRQRGRPARVRMTLPIRFSLSEGPPTGLRDG